MMDIWKLEDETEPHAGHLGVSERWIGTLRVGFVSHGHVICIHRELIFIFRYCV